MARIPVPCGHVDFPCCGCDEVVLTGEDALERMREEGLEMDLDERAQQEEDFDEMMQQGRTQRILDDTQPDGLDLHDIAFEDRMCGEAY